METNFSVYYLLARASYNKCILDKDNDYLNQELNFSLCDIILIDHELKLLYSGNDFDSFKIEVSLKLLNNFSE